MADLRKDLPPLPPRFHKLKLDARGYPVPFFVAWINGVADFRIVDPDKMDRCVRNDLCWLCGEPLGKFKAFVVGPMCGVNRVSSEPPSHRDCAEFAAKACPFLVRPKSVRRDANRPDDISMPAGDMIERNPGVTLIWVTRSWRTFPARNGHLIRMGEPDEMLWFREGRAATRAEIDASIESGFPILAEAAERDGPEAVEQLARMRARFEALLPVA